MNTAYKTLFLLTQVMCLLLYLDQDYPSYVLTVLLGSRLPSVNKVVSSFWANCCIMHEDVLGHGRLLC